jgi:hypothetical protein
MMFDLILDGMNGSGNCETLTLTEQEVLAMADYILAFRILKHRFTVFITCV